MKGPTHVICTAHTSENGHLGSHRLWLISKCTTMVYTQAEHAPPQGRAHGQDITVCPEWREALPLCSPLSADSVGPDSPSESE